MNPYAQLTKEDKLFKDFEEFRKAKLPCLNVTYSINTIRQYMSQVPA